MRGKNEQNNVLVFLVVNLLKQIFNIMHMYYLDEKNEDSAYFTNIPSVMLYIFIQIRIYTMF